MHEGHGGILEARKAHSLRWVMETDTTLFLAQALGIYMFVMGIPLVAYFRELQEAMEEFMASKMLYYLAAELTFIVGLLMILSHTKFTNEPLAVVVTIASYLIFIKGLVLLFLPHSWINVVVHFFNKTAWYVIAGLLSIISGLVLMFFTFVWPILLAL